MAGEGAGDRRQEAAGAFPEPLAGGDAPSEPRAVRSRLADWFLAVLPMAYGGSNDVKRVRQFFGNTEQRQFFGNTEHPGEAWRKRVDTTINDNLQRENERTTSSLVCWCVCVGWFWGGGDEVPFNEGNPRGHPEVFFLNEVPPQRASLVCTLNRRQALVWGSWRKTSFSIFSSTSRR